MDIFLKTVDSKKKTVQRCVQYLHFGRFQTAFKKGRDLWKGLRFDVLIPHHLDYHVTERQPCSFAL